MENNNKLTEIVKNESVINENLVNAEKLNSLLNSDLKSVMSKAKVSLNLVRNYFDIEQGEIRQLFFVGRTSYISEDGNVRPAVLLLDVNKNLFVSPHSVIINAVSNLKLFSLIEITNKGKQKGNKYISFDVKLMITE